MIHSAHLLMSLSLSLSLKDSIEKLETELKLLRSSNPVQGTLASEGGGNRRSEGDSSHHPLHIPPITLPVSVCPHTEEQCITLLI